MTLKFIAGLVCIALCLLLTPPTFADEGLTLYTKDYYDILWQSYELYQNQNNTDLPKSKESLRIEADKKMSEWFHDTEIDPLILEKIGIRDTKALTFQDFAKKAKTTLESMLEGKEKTALSDRLRRFAYDMIGKHHDYEEDVSSIFHLLFSGKGNCVARNISYATVLNVIGISATIAITGRDEGWDHIICIVESSRVNPETNKYEKIYEISEIDDPFQGTPSYLLLRVQLTSGEAKAVRASELTEFQSKRKEEYDIDFRNLDFPRAIIYYSTGNMYDNSGEYRKAIKDYTEAIKLYPNFGSAYHRRIIAHCKLGEYQKAIEECNKIIERDPKAASIYYTRGIAYASMKDYANAMADFNEAISMGINLAWWSKLYYTIKRYTWDIIIAPFEVAYNFIAGLFSKGAEVKQVAQTDNRPPRNTAVTSAPADPKVKWYRDPILYR